MRKIIVNRDNFKIDEIELDQGTLSIGRSKERDLTIDDRTVSSHHANIVTIFGSTYIEDQGSTNGTFVNGKQTNTHTLHNGDVVTIGHYQLLFHGETPDNSLSLANATQVLDQGQVANLLELANQRNTEKKQDKKFRLKPLPVARASVKRKAPRPSTPPEKIKQPPKPPEEKTPPKRESKDENNKLSDIDTPRPRQDEPSARPSDKMHLLHQHNTSSPPSFKALMFAIITASIIFGLLFVYYTQ